MPPILLNILRKRVTLSGCQAEVMQSTLRNIDGGIYGGSGVTFSFYNQRDT